jgi:hypothetical protein
MSRTSVPAAASAAGAAAIAVLLAAAPSPAAAADREAVGSLGQLLPRRVPVAAVTGGQAFAIAVGPGASVVAGPYSLNVPGAKGTLALTLETPAVQPGRFSSPVRLRNGTDVPLTGLRVDIVGASVTSASSAPGPNAPSTDLRISSPSPLWFGELQPGRESPALLLDVDGLPEQPGSGTVVILGVVSGASAGEPPKPQGAPQPSPRNRRAKQEECPVGRLAEVRGEGWGQAVEPVSCLVGASGDLWVVDMSGDPVKVYDSRGSFLRSFGPGAAKGARNLSFGPGGTVNLLEESEEGGTAVFRTLRPF